MKPRKRTRAEARNRERAKWPRLAKRARRLPARFVSTVRTPEAQAWADRVTLRMAPMIERAMQDSLDACLRGSPEFMGVPIKVCEELAP